MGVFGIVQDVAYRFLVNIKNDCGLCGMYIYIDSRGFLLADIVTSSRSKFCADSLEEEKCAKRIM